MNNRTGRKRPTLNVYSTNLVLLKNVPSHYQIYKLRDEINERFGKVRFVETFEAWCRRKNGYVVLEFDTHRGMSNFVENLKHQDFLRQRVSCEVMENRERFFQKITDLTGVDLLECGGVPPSFDYNQNYGRRSYYNHSQNTIARIHHERPKKTTIANGSKSTSDKNKNVSPSVTPPPARQLTSSSLSHSSTVTGNSTENNGQSQLDDDMVVDRVLEPSNSLMNGLDSKGSAESLTESKDQSNSTKSGSKTLMVKNVSFRSKDQSNSTKRDKKTLMVKNLNVGFDYELLLALVRDQGEVVEHSILDGTTARFVFHDPADAQCTALVLQLDKKKFGSVEFVLMM